MNRLFFLFDLKKVLGGSNGHRVAVYGVYITSCEIANAPRWKLRAHGENCV